MDLSTTFASIRKQVAGLSLVALVAGLLATGVATAQTTGNIFSDVPADSWFAPYVNGLSEAGVIDSTSDMYRPGDLVNRAEMAKFAFMVSGLPMETAAEAPYKDVAMGQWYTDYVYTLTKNGIVSGDKLNGVPTGFFRPSDALNRAEASKMLVNSAQMAEDLSGAPHFPDVTTSDWYYNYVETLFNNGVVAGYPDGYFRPANNINRAEVAKMVYLSMNPAVDGFVLASAAAASKTKVELIFSMNVDETLAADEANYLIEDSSGNKLNVTAAEVVAGDTVHLTTATQTEGKVYYVTAKNLESDAGDSLANMDSVSFLGYGADVSGGPLSVALSTQTPVAGSIPQGATGVVFTCWDFQAGSDAAMIKSLRVHRVGPGNETAFTNVYLYRGDTRLTTGRSINNESQTVEFNNINQNISAGENAKICLVADLSTTSNGGVHAFELESSDDVLSNSSDMTGSFPLRGADQLITSALVGTTTVKKNGSLDEATIGDEASRIAQFEIVAGSSEDQYLNRIALYVRGRVTASNVKNLKLYVIGDEGTALATTSGVGSGDLATFSLAKPYKIGRGQSKIFYVTADISSARTGDDIKVYLDETTDVYVTGATYGYGTQVTMNGVAGTGYDGTEGLDGITGTSDDNYSYVLLKGSKFTVGFDGPVASDIAVNQKQARCMDLTLTNAAGLDVTIKDWNIQLDMATTTGAGGLIDTVAAPNTANFTQIKLARLNDDGSISGTLLGSSELVVTSPDNSQPVTLKGTASIASGESIKAAIVFDVANNVALNTQTIKCSLLPVTGADQVKDSNNDALGTANITPSSTIGGNTHTLVTSALTFTKSSSPSDGTKLAKGANNATLLAFQVKAGSSLDTTIKSLAFKGNNLGYDCDQDGDVDGVGTPCVEATFGIDFNADGDLLDSVAENAFPDTTDIKNLIDSIGIYDDTNTLISDLKSLPASAALTNDGTVTFNNLDIDVAKNATRDLFIKGNVSNSIAVPRLSETYLTGTPLVLDQNGQTVTGVDITAIDGASFPTAQLILDLGSNPTVTPSVSAANNPRMFAEGATNPVYAFTLKSTNGSSTLQDMTVNVSTTAVQLPVEKIALYSADSSGACDTATELKGLESVVATSATTGYVKFTNINKALTDSQNTFFCVQLKAKTVISGQPVSNSQIFLDTDANYATATPAIVFDKIQDQSGTTLTGIAPIVVPAGSSPSVFFSGVPTFAVQALPSTALTSTSEVMRFTAGSIGNVSSFSQLAVLLEGQAIADVGACELYRGDTLIATSPDAATNEVASGGNALKFFLPANFVAGGNTWSNGQEYKIQCSFAALVANDSVQAKLLPVTSALGNSAIIWDDGNGATLTDVAFALVDNILFFNNITASKLTAV